MRNENQFNAWFSKELRTLHSKGYFHLKASDKFTVGVADFIVWGKGNSSVMEVKYIKSLPKPGCKLLDHTFTGPQVTFLESIGLSGNAAYGLVAVGDKEDGKLYLIMWKDMPESGNWEVSDFLENQNKLVFEWNEWKQMIDICLA